MVLQWSDSCFARTELHADHMPAEEMRMRDRDWDWQFQLLGIAVDVAGPGGPCDQAESFEAAKGGS